MYDQLARLTSWQKHDPCAEYRMRQPHEQSMEHNQFRIGYQYTRYWLFDRFGNSITRWES